MNTNLAWNIAGVGPQTRLVAEEAARRAGMRLEDWLDEAVEQAAAETGASAEESGEDDWLDAVERRLERISRGERRTRGSELHDNDMRGDARQEESRERDSEDPLGSTLQRFERRVARSEERAARAFQSIARMLERSNAIRDSDRHALLEAARRLDSMNRLPPRDAAQTVESRRDSALRFTERSDLDSRFDARMDEIARRVAAPPRAPREPAHALESVPEKPRLDLRAAASQIAMRRQELEARGARGASASPRPERAPPPANAASGDAEPPATGDARSSADPSEDRQRVQSDRPAASESLLEDLRALAAKLGDMRREQTAQCVSAADVSAMRAEIAAMTRSLADLAPRNSVVALEGAIRDLTERVATLRENGHGESWLAPLDEMAVELRATLKAHDLQLVAAGLDREIRAISGKIDGLVETAINPDTFERIRRQTEEVRDLLAAAAMRSAPVERIERQIGELADRVERLSASPAPDVESARMAASLDEVRRQIERSTPVAALSSIERRLEHIAERLDQEIAQPAHAGIDLRPFDDLAERIDGVRQSLEAHARPQVDASALEASLKELSARLDRTAGGAAVGEIQSLLKDVAARLDRQSAPVIDTTPIENALRGIGSRPLGFDAEALAALMRDTNAKLDAAGRKDAGAHAIEPLLAEISAKLDAIDARTLGRGGIEEIIDEVSRRLEFRSAGQVDAEALAAQIANIHDRLDALTLRAGQADNTEPIVRELLDRLREAGPSLTSGGRDGPSGMQADLAGDLAELRAEQANADRRTHTRLIGLQDVLEKLVERLASLESEISGDFEADERPPVRAEAIRKPSTTALPGVEALGADDAADFAMRRRAVEAEALADTAKASSSAADDDASRPSPNSEDLLLEPGVGAPQRARDVRDAAQASGTRTNPTLSVHIAAARRAAQLALAESDGAAARPPGGAQPVRLAARGVAQAKSFYASHKRSVLLGVALLIVATFAVRLAGVHAPFLQKSDGDGRPVKAADAVSGRADFAARPIDSTPTASIAPAPELPNANTPAPPKVGAPPPPELLAAIPAGISQPLRDAVFDGAPGAQYELAQRLFEGRGLPRDHQAAALWFERAASLGLAPAQYRIGAMYEKGVGVARESATAKRWYLKAAEAGNARAAHNLAVMSAESVGDKPDYVEAAKWFRKAGEMSVRDSQFNLAVLYARGLGVEQDLRQSWLWFSLAAAQGDQDAGKKRDEVAAKMDTAALAAAQDALAKFKVVKPDPVANEVAAPPGGWDAKPASPSVGQTASPIGGGARLQTPL